MIDDRVFTKAQNEAMDSHALLLIRYRQSIRLFIKDMWGLEPQPVKPEYQKRWEEVELSSGETWERLKEEVTAEWFGDRVNSRAVIPLFEPLATYTSNESTPHAAPHKNSEEKKQNIKNFENILNKEEGDELDIPRYKWHDFQKGTHFTWQQNLILMGIEKAVAGDAPTRLSTVSGHGIGKSATCSWITLWFLFCYYDAQIPVTAPTSAQMHDVLWKEMSIWITKMPDAYADLYEWSKDYIRMAYAPDSWFARARTSTKENTEAIAGVHSDHVMIVVDEASGVPEQVFETAQGALTSGNVFIVLISNGTRPLGYFWDTHNRNEEDWQNFQFNCEDSPIVDNRYPVTMAKQYGIDSEEYAIRVRGKFPRDASMDDSGYLQLIPRDRVMVRTEQNIGFLGRNILGVDPSGEGKDKATWVIRDRFKAMVVMERATTNPRQVAEDTITLMDRYDIRPEDVVIDAFGIGADVGKEIAIASQGRYDVYTPLVGNTPKKEEAYNAHFFERFENELQNPEGTTKQWEDLYANVRALMYFRLRDWLVQGGEICDTSLKSDFAFEIVQNRWKRTLQGNKIQLMPKKEMQKLRIKSPNKADALALTFLRELKQEELTTPQKRLRDEEVLNYNEDERALGEDRFSSV